VRVAVVVVVVVMVIIIIIIIKKSLYDRSRELLEVTMGRRSTA